MFDSVFPSLFTPELSSKENKTLVSGEETKQRPGLHVSGLLHTRERHQIGFCSADLDLSADTWLVLEGATKAWLRGSSEWPAARAVGL